MEKLKTMKETLCALIQTQLMDVAHVDAHELGEVVDMLKDVEESMYYCAKVKEIEDCEKEHEEIKKKMEKMEKENPREFHHYYSERFMPMPYPDMYYPPFDRDMDRDMGRMYYSERQPRNAQGQFTDGRGSSRNFEEGRLADTSFNSRGGSQNFYEKEVPFDFRDHREGRSPMSRRNYMESKELHQDKEKKMKELEKYMKELSEDIVEMIQDASPEEKQMLEKKMTHLTSKIAQLNTNA